MVIFVDVKLLLIILLVFHRMLLTFVLLCAMNLLHSYRVRTFFYEVRLNIKSAIIFTLIKQQQK